MKVVARFMVARIAFRSGACAPTIGAKPSMTSSALRTWLNIGNLSEQPALVAARIIHYAHLAIKHHGRTPFEIEHRPCRNRLRLRMALVGKRDPGVAHLRCQLLLFCSGSDHVRRDGDVV